MSDVDGVGIGKQRQAIALRQSFQEVAFEHGHWIDGAIPRVGELLEGEGAAKTFRKVEVPIARRDSALLPIRPARIMCDGGPEVAGRKGDALGQSGHGAGDVQAHENATDVEDDGAELGNRHGLFALDLRNGNLARSAAGLGAALGAEDADDRRKDREHDDDCDDVMNPLADIGNRTAEEKPPKTNAAHPETSPDTARTSTPQSSHATST